MTRCLVALVVGALALPTVSAHTVGPVDAEAKFNKMSDCTIGTDLICLASWNQGTDDGFGDDEIDTTLIVEEATVSIQADGVPPKQVSMNTADLILHHSAWVPLNETWIRLNESLPAPAKALVILGSGPRGTPGGDGPRPWHLFVTAYLPLPVDDPMGGEPYTYISPQGVSPDCSAYFTNYSNWDKACSEDTIRPVPNGLRETDNTDRMVAVTVEKSTNCDSIVNTIRSDAPPVCVLTEEAAPMGDAIYQGWTGMTPDVREGTGVKEIRASLSPTRQSATVFETGHAPFVSEVSGGKSSLPLPLVELGGALPAQDGAASIPSEPSHRISDAPPAERDPLAGETTVPAQPNDAWLMTVAAVGALVIAWLLYSRIPVDRVLHQPTRQRIYETIGAHPGVRVGTLRVILGLHYMTVWAHVRRLQEAGLVEATDDGQARMFVAGLGKETRNAAIALSTPAAQAVHNYLRQNGVSELPAIRMALNLPKASASQAVKRLEKAGLIATRRERKRLVVSLRELPKFHEPSGQWHRPT